MRTTIKSKWTNWSLLTLASFTLLLSGCGMIPFRDHVDPIPLTMPTEATYFDVYIKSFDGTKLSATIYQPKLEPGETAPLIIQTHGFGGHRTFDPRSIYGLFIISGEAAIEAWKQGYWVISYDQRGFGYSDGSIHLMHPEKEVEDLSSVIDWAEDNMLRVTRDENDDMLIGTMGESYGAAVQILASMNDERIDAIVPVASWYDLEEAIAPNDHVKGAWGGTLVGLGTVLSFFDFGMALSREYLSLINGEMNPQVEADLAIRSPSHYCQQGKSVHADALFMQGFRDTLFPVNHGVSNWKCAAKNGNDSRLIALQDGHILPWPVQSWSGFPLFNTQPNIKCGDKQFSTIDMIVSWWDLKLKNKPMEQEIPKLCVTLSDD
ncbi:MAG: CocE/NonD family hydrolase, partial [Pseudomonadales bacterium]|nr:CocE/NonD family hydrolase [Pseudomonadales bacterium]